MTLEPLVLPSLKVGPHLFLSGPMAVGKSTVGPLVAARLGRPFVDLDAQIEARVGVGVGEFFRVEGEHAFRVVEAEVATAIAERDEPLVVALGGGTVASGALRRELLWRGILVTMRADAALLAERAGDHRPLLAGATTAAERARRLGEIVRTRSSAYAEAHLCIEVGGRTSEAVADAIASGAAKAPILVPLGARSYGVTIASGVIGELGILLAAAGAEGRVLVVTDDNARPHAERALTALAGAGLEPRIAALPAGEAHKTVRSLEALWDAALAHGVDRGGAIVAVGGGVVGDVAGLAAATLLRGVRWAQVPTTLLSMVDAAVGGKTAIDRPEGKNLVGAFHQPALVLVDPDTLFTLPDRAFRAGLAEVVKCAWIAGEADLSQLEEDAASLVARDPRSVRGAIEMAVRVKARIVAFDEREEHARLALNLGHTIGHALEAASDHALEHGEAVGLGLLAAHRVARSLGSGSEGDEARTAALLSRLGLPVDLEAAGIESPALERFVLADKKSRAGNVRFVVPAAPGVLKIARLVARDVLAAARRR